MYRAFHHPLILLILIFSTFFLIPPLADSAGSHDQLASDIEKALRSAEKSIFGGNMQEGAAIISEVSVKLEELKAADPNNRKLITISSKFNQLQKKLGQYSPVTAASAPQAKPANEAKASEPAAPDNNASTQAISGVAAIALTGMTGHLDRAEKTMQSGTGDLGKASLARAADKYDELAKRYPDLATQPPVIAAKQRLDTLIVQADKAEEQKQANQAKNLTDSQEQAKLIEQWRKTFMAYTTPREEKYLGQHPELLDEARNVLAEYEKTPFPLGHPAELRDSAVSLQKAITHAAAEQGAAGIDDQWLPRIKPLLAANDPAYISPGGPNLQQINEVTRMDGNAAVGKQLLDDYDKQFPNGQSTHFLGQAIDQLRRAVEGYQQGRKDAVDRLAEELHAKIERSLEMLGKNQDWTAASGKPIYIINNRDMTEMDAQLAALKLIPGVPAATLASFDQDVARVRSLDTDWRERKTAQENAPRPFPTAGMTSLSLVAEMEKILKDRGIGAVDKLVIVDKDWWVQKGEFRYIKAAALQKDGEGPYFTYVTFKQMQTLAGYGPTELWEQGKKVRIAD